MNLHHTRLPISKRDPTSDCAIEESTVWNHYETELKLKSSCEYGDEIFQLKSSYLPVKAPSFEQLSDVYTRIQTISQEQDHAMNSQFPPDLLEVVREMTTLLIHRYRSPLTGIMGFIDLIKTTESSVNKHYIETIVSGLNELSGLLDEMEELNREKAVNLNEISVMEQIQTILENYPKQERSRIRIFDYSETSYLLADRILLKSILISLLDNALEHDRVSNTEIIIEIFKEGKTVFTNFGTPIPEDFTLKMFYPFYTTKARNMGLGLTRASIAAQAQDLVIELVSNSEVDGISFAVHTIK